MVFFNVCRLFHDDVRSLPSTYEFKLKVNINVKWLHLLKLGYIAVMAVIIFLVYLTGGWNYKEGGVSSVVIKVKGANFYNGVIWDAVDYVYPPQEVRAFFITTRAVVTKQSQKVCPDKANSSRCSKDVDCRHHLRTENGIKTGKCDLKSGMCLIHAWCPLEEVRASTTSITPINGAANFTVYVRVHEEFIKFNISRSNDANSIKSSSNCLFHPKNDRTCPTFKIEDILKESQVKFDQVKKEGGVFQFYIKWHCYFNWNSPPCSPRYLFKRIAKDNNGQFTGYHMRYAIYKEVNGIKHRDLITVYGLRFLIMIKSTGEQFRWTSFLSNVGSYLSYFGIWTFVTGVLCALFLMDKRDLLTLDEATLVRLLRSQDPLAEDASEMKVLSGRQDGISGEQKVALVSGDC